MSERAIKRASEMNVQADFMYCMDMLNETGIMVVPGSGFGQREGTYHFRITNLVSPSGEMASTLENLKEFNESWHARYA
jgi:alanine transaminase